MLAAAVILIGFAVPAGNGQVAGAQESEPVPWLDQLELPEPGRPVAVEANATAIEDHLFEPHPEQWGGMYIDGDTLVVLTVTRDIEEATEELRALGVTQGVTVRRTDVSMAQLDDVTAAITADPRVQESYTSAGPDYSQSRVVVGLESNDLATRETLAEYADGVEIVTYSAPGEPTLASSGQFLLLGSFGAASLIVLGVATSTFRRLRHSDRESARISAG